MPLNFPEIWERRVREKLTSQTEAPFLDGIAEMDAEVATLGGGDASESNVIHVPLSTFEPDVLLNNTTYPIPVQPFDDSSAIVQLDKYQTKVTTLSDDQIIGASYDRIDAATRSHVQAITKKKYQKALHAMAPAGNTANTPVLQTTGELVNGRRRLRLADLVDLQLAFDGMECPVEGRRLVLSPEHKSDLLLDDSKALQALNNYKTGDPAPVICGFEIYSYVVPPKYNTAGNKVAFDAVAPDGSTTASVAFWTGNVARKTGLTKQYFKKASDDPDNQTNRINYRHYYINMPLRNKYIGAFVSAAA